LLRWATRQRYIGQNPAENLELPKRVKAPPRYLTREDYLKLRSSIDDEEFRDVVDFYLLTGIRRGEGLLLKIEEHFDLNGG